MITEVLSSDQGAPPGLTVSASVSIEVTQEDKGICRRGNLLNWCLGRRHKQSGSVPRSKDGGRLPSCPPNYSLKYRHRSGGNKNCHPSLPPLTVGNSKVEESPTPHKEAESRAFATHQGEPATQNSLQPIPLAPLAGVEHTWRGSHIVSLGCALPDPMGKVPATRRLPSCPTPTSCFTS